MPPKHNQSHILPGNQKTDAKIDFILDHKASLNMYWESWNNHLYYIWQQWNYNYRLVTKETTENTQTNGN